jgi:hypothetical protein
VGSKRSVRPRRTIVRGGSPLAHGKRSIFEDAMVDPHILLLFLTFSVATTIVQGTHEEQLAFFIHSAFQSMKAFL